MTDPLISQDPQLAEIVRRLVEAYQPERIYLFGSMARGDAGPDSDYDLMVVVPDDAPPERRRGPPAYHVVPRTGRGGGGRGWGGGGAARVGARATFDRRLSVRTSLPATIVAEGRLLHAA